MKKEILATSMVLVRDNLAYVPRPHGMVQAQIRDRLFKDRLGIETIIASPAVYQDALREKNYSHHQVVFYDDGSYDVSPPFPGG